MKVYKVLYFSFMSIFTVIAVGFAILCFHYDRLPEGLILIGCVYTIFTICYALYLSIVKLRKDEVLASAGVKIVATKCVCKINNQHGVDCVLSLNKNGVLVDAKDMEFVCIPYTDFMYRGNDAYSVTISRVSFDDSIEDVVYRFVISSRITAKAVIQVLQNRCCHDDYVLN